MRRGLRLQQAPARIRLQTRQYHCAPTPAPAPAPARALRAGSRSPPRPPIPRSARQILPAPRPTRIGPDRRTGDRRPSSASRQRRPQAAPPAGSPATARASAESAMARSGARLQWPKMPAARSSRRSRCRPTTTCAGKLDGKVNSAPSRLAVIKVTSRRRGRSFALGAVGIVNRVFLPPRSRFGRAFGSSAEAARVRCFATAACDGTRCTRMGGLAAMSTAGRRGRIRVPLLGAPR